MRLITRKSEVKLLLKECLTTYHMSGIDGLLEEFDRSILKQKVKFPLLEYCAKEIIKELRDEEHIPFCDQVEELKTEGGNVILGIILQERLNDHYQESLIKATEYISKATIWYVCDIIGERVFGHALLHFPDKTIPEVELLLKHESQWVVRSIGAGIHYSIKKGIGEYNAYQLFSLLLNLANTTNKEIRQGIGWAAKTTAKFHPEIIEQNKEHIENTQLVANWFRRKIEIGLSRYHYAQAGKSKVCTQQNQKKRCLVFR